MNKCAYAAKRVAGLSARTLHEHIVPVPVMRITFLTSALENVAGYWRAFYLGKYLAARGHTVYIFAQRNAYTPESKVIDNVNVYLLPSFSKGATKLKSASAVMSLIYQTCFNALSTLILKTDVLHVFDVLIPQNAIAVLISKTKLRKDRPLVFVDWDDWWGRGGILDTFHKEIGSYMIQFLTFLEEKIPLNGDAVTVTSEALKKRALSVGVKAERIFIVPSGTDIKSAYCQETQAARKLLNLPENAIIYTCNKSSFDRIKPYDDPLWDLLVAHKIVVSSFSNALLVFLGRRSENCIAMAKKFRMEKNVISVGWQPADRYALYLAASDFLLLPTRDTVFDKARCPLRLLDYLASGKPVIATDLPEVRKIVKSSGLLTKPGDPEDLAHKIIAGIENSHLLKQVAKSARTTIIHDYSWQNIAEELEKLYYAFACGVYEN